MTTSIITAAWSQASTAAMRVWAKAISDSFKAVGLVKTTDAGQVEDWTTHSMPDWSLSDSFLGSEGASVGGQGGWLLTGTGATAVFEGNQLRLKAGSASTPAHLVRATMSVDGVVSVKVMAAEMPELVWRAQSSASSCYAFNPVAGEVRRRTSATTSYTVLNTFTPFTPAAGDVLSVEFDGSSYVCKHNGVEVASGVEGSMNSYSYVYVGVFEVGSATGSLFDDFQYTSGLRPASDSNPYYEVFRMGDTQQEALPVFIKVSYGSEYYPDNPSLAFYVGTGSDGAGNLTGNVSSRAVSRVGQTAGQADGGTYPFYACATDGYFFFGTYFNGNPQAYALVVERTRNASGICTPDGLFAMFTGASAVGTSYISQYSADTATWPLNQVDPESFFAFPAIGSSLVVGTTVLVFPLNFLSKIAAQPLYKMLGLVVCASNDFAVDVNANYVRYDGATHTYRRIMHGPIPGASYMVLWE